jgi:glycogen phosphorylase
MDRWSIAGRHAILHTNLGTDYADSTGWAIDSTAPATGERTPHDAASLYDKLESVVLPLFYQQRERFVDVMRHAIALNGSFFNTQRMVLQYVLNAYFE